MKNTKTTIRELSARYRDILKKCFFLNAVAIGLFAATSASAAVNVVTNVTFDQGMSDATLTATSVDISGAIITAVSDNIKNTVYSDGKYNASNSAYRTDGASTLSVTTGAPAADDYQFTLGDSTRSLDGAGDGTNMYKSLIAVSGFNELAAKADGTVAGSANYATAEIARNNDQLYTQTAGSYKFQMGATAADDPTAATAASSFKFASTKAGADVTLADAGYSMAAEGQYMDATANLAYTGYSWTDWSGATIALDGNGLDPTVYTFTNTDGDPDNLGNYITDGVLNLPMTEFDNAAVAVGHYNTDKAAYEAEEGVWSGDNTKYQAAVTKYNNERAAFDALVDAYDNAETGYAKGYADATTAYNTANTDYQAADTAYDADVVSFGTKNTEYAAYNNSVQQAVDNRADAAVTRGLEDEGAIANAIDAKITAANGDMHAVTTAIMGDSYTGDDLTVAGAFQAVMGKAEDVFVEKQQWVDNTLGITSANADAVKTEYASTNYLKNAETLTAADKALDAELAKKANLTDVYTRTEAEAIFAEKQQWVDNTLGITSANADAVKTEYADTNYLAEATTLTGADIALDTQIKANADDISALQTTVGDANSGLVKEVNTLTGDAETAGSVLNAIATANDYTDSAVGALATGAVQDNADAIAALQTTVGDADSGLVKDVATLQTTVGDADSGLVKDVATLQTTVGDANSGLVKDVATLQTTVGDANSGLVKAVADNATAISAEVQNREQAFSTLSANLTAESQAREATVGTAAAVAGIQGSYTANKAGGSATAKTLVDHVQALNDTLEGVLGTAEELQAVFDGQSANTLASYLTNQAAGAAQTQASNEAQFAKLSSKINKLETKMEKGLAANNALAGLVPLDHVHKTQISAALGGYENNQALAVGAFHYLNSRTLLNAGAAYGGNDSVSYKVGVTFGF